MNDYTSFAAKLHVRLDCGLDINSGRKSTTFAIRLVEEEPG